MNDLDYGKRYVFDFHKELRQELGLPDYKKENN